MEQHPQHLVSASTLSNEGIATGPVEPMAEETSSIIDYKGRAAIKIRRTTSQQSSVIGNRPSCTSSTQSSRMRSMLQPPKPVGPAPGMFQSLKSIFFASWLNILLVFIPISWALSFALEGNTHRKDIIVFTLSFLAILPLARLLAFATEDLSMRIGQTLAGLLNATLGNVVELTVAIIALLKCELRVVQSSLVGSVLCKLLLVLGMCFLRGGIGYFEQGFGLGAMQISSSLLMISVIAVLLPAAFHTSIQGSNTKEEADMLALSRGIAVVLLLIYIAYLFFQFYSHKAFYKDEGEGVIESTSYGPQFRGGKTRNSEGDDITLRAFSPSQETEEYVPDVEAGLSHQEGEEEMPQMSVWISILLIAVVTALTAVTATFLVGSIDGVTATGTISKQFVAIVFPPLVANAIEPFIAFFTPAKDEAKLHLSTAVGSSLQITLLLLPFMVTLAWMLGKPLTLVFDPYESVTLFLSVLTVNYIVQDGKSNWLEGVILICLYVILGVTFWFYPGSNPSLLATCK